MLTFEKWMEEKGLTLHPWQKQASDVFFRVLYAQKGKAVGKTLLADLMLEFVNRHGNEFELPTRPAGSADFPPLIGGDNRPVGWDYGLETVDGTAPLMTNGVTIWSRPVLDVDDSGQHGYEKLARVTLVRSEIAEILRVLDEDIAEARKHCPQQEFA